jgi:hypothetical protein
MTSEILGANGKKDIYYHSANKGKHVNSDDLGLDNEDIDSEMFGELKNQMNEKIDLMKLFIGQSISRISEDCS